ncbi:MAG: hypothetical protein O2931_03515 [Planctomycetota bacterium]|nr:hypothetical protein [Planctomycetota bacterium]MDA1177845.1 hypothetical protein [Planctomycetota bacterium]
MKPHGAYDRSATSHLLSMLSFWLSGTVTVGEEIDIEALPAHLADCLERVNAASIVVEGWQVNFRGGLFRSVRKGNLLVPFGSGSVCVDPDLRLVVWRVSILELLFAAAGVVSVGALIVWIAS